MQFDVCQYQLIGDLLTSVAMTTYPLQLAVTLHRLLVVHIMDRIIQYKDIALAAEMLI